MQLIIKDLPAYSFIVNKLTAVTTETHHPSVIREAEDSLEEIHSVKRIIEDQGFIRATAEKVGEAYEITFDGFDEPWYHKWFTGEYDGSY